MQSVSGSRNSRRVVGWGITGLLVLLAAVIVLWAVFRGPIPGPGAYYGFLPFFPFSFGWGWGIFLIFIIFWMVRWFVWPWGGRYSRRYWRYGDEAYNILRQRYAKGEVTKEQFEQMMRDLEQHS